jgi:hypothetical protein
MIQNVLIILASWAITLAMRGGRTLIVHESPAGYEHPDIITLSKPPDEGKLSVESGLAPEEARAASAASVVGSSSSDVWIRVGRG